MNIIKCDLFEIDDKYDLVHCISNDCAMGAGIALEFRKKFPEMKYKIQQYLKLTNKQYPVTVGYVTEGRIIFNLITKEFYYNKPTYDTIREALVDLRRLMESRDRRYIAMPMIGCGLDKLKWEIVRNIIEEVFDGSEIDIIICVKK